MASSSLIDAESLARTVYTSFQHVPISAVLSHRDARSPGARELVSVDENTSLGDVLRTLSNYNVLAVPVTGSEKQFVGIVSVWDIVAWTVFEKVFDDLESSIEGEGFMEQYSATAEKRMAHFDTKVGDLVRKSAPNTSVHTLNARDPLSTLLSVLTATHHHRVLIATDGNGGQITLTTLTDVARFLVDRLKSGTGIPEEKVIWSTIAGAVDRHIGERGHRERKVVTVPDTATALEGFRVLHANDVTAVAVVDADGRIAANLSASDMRGMTDTSLESLTEPVYNFLETGTKRKPDQLKSDQLRVVEPTTPLITAVEKARSPHMLEAHIHRVWITGETDEAIGVVTVTDALSMFVPQSAQSLPESQT
ncbi:hypothetical protein HK104_008219 [Borealophlyctis nickersoniae]|nr:hypothetical protein HK104_008219 [Borealophlyctis nickersoniae]